MADDTILKGEEHSKVVTEGHSSDFDAVQGLREDAYGIPTNTLSMTDDLAEPKVNECTSQQPDVDFHDAQQADERAAELWKKVDQNQNPDFRDILAFRNFIDIAAKQRLSGRGGLDKQPSANTAENLSSLAQLDPNKDTRAVPAADKPGSPTYLTADEQRCLLASASLEPKDRAQSITVNNQKAKLIDVELAYRANPNSLDPAAEKTLHKQVRDNLKRHFKDAASESKFATKYGLNQAEMQDLRTRFKEADTFCKANP